MVSNPNPATIKVMMRSLVWKSAKKGLAEPESLSLTVREAKAENSLRARTALQWPAGIHPQDLHNLQIKWFRSGSYVGFLVSATSEGSVAIWTTTGLEDPAEMNSEPVLSESANL